MPDQPEPIPDSTAVRVALWRALHVQVDAPPHVLEDEIGLKIAAPDQGWRERPDMHPQGTARMRAEIAARARLVEDIVIEQAGRGVGQYVIVGAGLDTFAQRRPEVAARLRIYEIDQPGPQAWKRQRLIELGYGVAEGLQLVPVNFEENSRWWEQLIQAGFDATRPAVVASTGVTQYISKGATAATFRQMASLASGSTFITTFMVPIDLVEADERQMTEWATAGAQASGTPFISFFRPEEILALAHDSGFREARYISTADLTERYFAGRTDGLKPASGEQLMMASV